MEIAKSEETDYIFSDDRNLDESANVLLSFIIPIYNTSKFLQETLSSIACLGRRDIELIIVNDGSTDNSHDVILGWLEDNPSEAVYIRQQNSGLSSARISGAKYARGRYIGFCDSDDRINIQTYVNMAELCINYGSDVALCRSTVFDSASDFSYDFYDFL